MSVQGEVGPYLVGDDVHVVLPEELHGLFQFPALPDAAAGVVGRAEDGGVDLVVRQLFLHILEVHPPDMAFILEQGAVDNAVAAILQTAGEADVGGRVEENLVSPGADGPQGAENTAQNAVFIADALPGQTGDAVAVLLPADNGFVVFAGWLEVAVGRVLSPGNDGPGDGGEGGEIHIRHPHGDEIKALLGP